jgi:hypothetical protein
MLTSPRNGQSSAIIITITKASVAATVAVIARCKPKLSKPKKLSIGRGDRRTKKDDVPDYAWNMPLDGR